jgi:2-polyprenyl-3-methyl-5-hydroxy-6-metoxy-1,4-benzoquinol methylase
MTEYLATSFARVVSVEGSNRLAAALNGRFPGVEVCCSLFEDFNTEERFDAIVLGHVLEHVADPPHLLRRVAGWLAEDGIVCAAVPNARSLHRQAAVIMGLLATEHALNEADVHHGHRRIYDPESFRNEFQACGFEIDLFGGYWLKPVSNAQIDKDWSPGMVNAFFRLGERYPDVAAEIYVIARAKPDDREPSAAR